MTTIAGISIQTPASYSVNGYDVSIVCTLVSELIFDTVRELFSLCDTTTIQWIPGRHPIGYDPTEDQVNTVYVAWTQGDKPENGYYLLRNFEVLEDETPFGHAWGFKCTMTFLGTAAYLTAGLDVVDLDEVSNDWTI